MGVEHDELVGVVACVLHVHHGRGEVVARRCVAIALVVVVDQVVLVVVVVVLVLVHAHVRRRQAAHVLNVYHFVVVGRVVVVVVVVARRCFVDCVWSWLLWLLLFFDNDEYWRLLLFLLIF